MLFISQIKLPHLKCQLSKPLLLLPWMKLNQRYLTALMLQIVAMEAEVGVLVVVRTEVTVEVVADAKTTKIKIKTKTMTNGQRPSMKMSPTKEIIVSIIILMGEKHFIALTLCPVLGPIFRHILVQNL